MSDVIRAFIAIELSSGIKEELGRLQADLKSANADLKWVDLKSIHLTLKFLGNIQESRIEDIKRILDGISSRHNKFEISLSSIGGFPNVEYPRVIWVGIQKGASESESIAKDIEQELLGIGFEKEKRGFTAHLTLGRIRSHTKGRDGLVSRINALDFKPSASCAVDKITLFQSTLAPQGAIYTPLHEARLR